MGNICENICERILTLRNLYLSRFKSNHIHKVRHIFMISHFLSTCIHACELSRITQRNDIAIRLQRAVLAEI